MAKEVKKTTKKTALPKDTVSLAAEKRTIVGRKVKTLRKKGIVPANVYGAHVKSVLIQVAGQEFAQVFTKVGETGLVGLDIEGDTRPVLVHNIQRDPVTDQWLHIDFLQVDLAQKVTATVPIEFVGEAEAEKDGVGIIVHQVNEVEVEALPTDLPERITVDVSKLSKVDDAIKISELDVDRSKIEIKEDPEQAVVYIAEPQQEEPEPVAEIPAEGEAQPASASPEATVGKEGASEGGPAAQGSGEVKEQKPQEGPK